MLSFCANSNVSNVPPLPPLPPSSPSLLLSVLKCLSACTDISVCGSDHLSSLLSLAISAFPSPGLSSLLSLLASDLREVEATWAEGGWKKLGREDVAGVVRKSFEESERRDRVVELVLEE